MKKRLFIILLIIVSIFSYINVYAMSESDVKSHFKFGSVKIPDEYLNQFDKYTDEFEISSKDCDYISKRLDFLNDVAKKKKIKTISEFEDKCAADIKATVTNISENTGVKLTILSNGKLKVSKYNSKDTYVIVNTNISTNSGSPYLIYIAFTVTVLGAILLVFRVRNA